jgi:hypothetical protein
MVVSGLSVFIDGQAKVDSAYAFWLRVPSCGGIQMALSET